MQHDIIEYLLWPVERWLREGGDAWEMDLAYWQRRRALMDGGASFEGDGSATISSVDTAMDCFSPDQDRAQFQIDEGQLRQELMSAIDALRRSGLMRHQRL